MAWQDRLSTAAYTSPEGNRFTFVYEDVSRSITKKTSAFDFPNVNATLVQDFGRTGRRYPLRVIFTGNDYDLDADRFFAAMSERGAGLLEHPRYGSVTVVPTGEVRQRDDLKTAGNQAIFEVSFWETVGVTLLAPQADPRGSIFQALEDFIGAAADAFSAVLGRDSASERGSLAGVFERLTGTTTQVLGPIAAATESVDFLFQDISDSINAGISQLISDPLTLAAQVGRLIQTPGRAAAAIQSRLDGYEVLARGIIESSPPATAGEFATLNLFAVGDVTGTVVSVVSQASSAAPASSFSATAIGGRPEFQTQSEALDAAELILDLFAAVMEWRDENANALGVNDGAEEYQQLQTAVGLAAGFIVNLSFSLQQERRLVLDRNRNLIELVGELYGEIDNRLDFFINSNSLTGSEILELPAGREVVYYR